MNRRLAVLGVFAVSSLAFLAPFGRANTLPKLVVYRNPGCGCCEGWVRHMKAASFEVTMEDDPNLDDRRRRLNIPAELASCHIAMAMGYAFQGHIPSGDVVKFLQERPPGAIGLVVPVTCSAELTSLES
ncbi:MAG: DUF411 domain-containing protein [Aestuariivirga sp.]